MNIDREVVHGTLIAGETGHALRLNSPNESDVVYLAYALVTQGPEYHILPSVLLDDWGNEIGGLNIYEWVKVNGLKFPRAEVFGLSPTGEQVQYFLRDLELLAEYPVYAFADSDAPVQDSVLLKAILVPDEEVASFEEIIPPADVSAHLRAAMVKWYRVNPRQTDLGVIDGE